MSDSGTTLNSPRHSPFKIGFLATVLIFAALNAASWFFRSSSWGNLCGYTQTSSGEAIGFPFEFWRINQIYHGGWLFNFPVLFGNAAIALVVSVTLGLILKRTQPWINNRLQAHRPPDTDRKPKANSATFSLRGLLFLTTLLAASIALFQRLGPSPELLAGIFFGGPALLLAIAMFPSGLAWDNRAWIIVGTAGLLISAAIAIGNNLSMPFDRVLLGIFISWVPQSVAGAGMAFALLLTRQPGPSNAPASPNEVL